MSFNVFGIFCLANGRPEPGSSLQAYDSTIMCSDNSTAPLSIVLFKIGPVYPDLTTAFIFGKFAIPVGGGVIKLHAMHVHIIPGDPLDESYDASIPDMLYPIVSAVGHVIAEPNRKLTAPAFKFSTSAFVNRVSVTSHVTAAFVNRKRWSSIPTITMNDCIQVAGTCLSFDPPTNTLTIAVDDLSLGLTTLNKSSSVVPTNGRRFQAFLPSTNANAPVTTANAPVTSAVPAPVAPVLPAIPGPSQAAPPPVTTVPPISSVAQLSPTLSLPSAFVTVTVDPNTPADHHDNAELGVGSSSGSQPGPTPSNGKRTRGKASSSAGSPSKKSKGKKSTAAIQPSIADDDAFLNEVNYSMPPETNVAA
ncbi:hypothetical protein CPC08DRAFT_762134 [Agrocybe pediades]|nr:hypothetical protein CPC08DRAFT_762134 [Agrocybe pediades]